jgi:hypothetical protein
MPIHQLPLAPSEEQGEPIRANRLCLEKGQLCRHCNMGGGGEIIKCVVGREPRRVGEKSCAWDVGMWACGGG